MGRPRKKGWEYLPENLHVQIRGGQDYFTYRNPVTGKSLSLGYDCQAAMTYALRANQGVVDPMVDRGGPSERTPSGDLLDYQAILTGAVDSIAIPGVYFLLQDDDLVYIGKSMEPEARIGQHRSRGRIPFNRAMIVRCGATALARLEARYIRKFRPFYNAVSPLALDENDQ